MNFNKKQISFIAKFINSLENLLLVKRLNLKYPLTIKFIFNRLSLNKFEGLPLTLLLALFGANSIIFNELAESIQNSKLMLHIDDSFAQYLFNNRNNTVANLFYYFSKLGSLNVVIAISLIITIILIWKKQKSTLISLTISLMGIGLSVLLGKQYFHRIRPERYSYYIEHSYSFPSGHAIVSVAFYGLISYIFIRNSKNNKVRWTIFAMIFILLLGFSRLYLCVHFLSDVLAGYSLGFIWLLLSISIIEWKALKKSH